MSGYHKTVFDNGLTLVSERFPSRVASLGLWINAGSRDDEVLGSAHFVEHLLFKGTASRDARRIARDLDRLGGQSNAFTTKEQTCLYGTVRDLELPRLIELLVDLLLNSQFPEEEAERERQVVLQEIGMALDTPEDRIQDLFAEMLWAGHPLAWPVLGESSTVAGMTAAQLHGFRAGNYLPSRLVVSAAGNVEHRALVAMLAGLAAWVPAAAAPPVRPRATPSPQPARIKVHPKRLEQTHLLLGVPGPPAHTERRYVLALLNTVLGGNMSSRLFQEVREKRGLAYSIYSFADGLSDAGMLGIYAGVGHESVPRMRGLIEEVISGICRGGISEDELRGALEFAKAGVVLAEESAEARMMRLARNELTLGRHVPLEEVEAGLERVRTEEVGELAASLFAAPLTGVILGPVRKDDCQPDEGLLSGDEDD